eukprot:1155848-Pelagomonas_calceolata.AAC.7
MQELGAKLQQLKIARASQRAVGAPWPARERHHGLPERRTTAWLREAPRSACNLHHVLPERGTTICLQHAPRSA